VRRLAAVIGALGLVATACGLTADDAPRAIDRNEVLFDLLAPRPTTTTTATTEVPVRSTEITIYLVGADGHLVPVERTLPQPITVVERVQALIDGATDSEADQGLRSVLSPDLRLLGAERIDNQVILDFSQELDLPQGEDRISATAQIVFTATEVEGIVGVQLSLGGSLIEAPRSDGTLTSGPVTRFSFETLAPAPTTTSTTSPTDETS